MEKINHLKINHARSRKTSRKMYLKINRKVHARSPRKTSPQGPRMVQARSPQGPRKVHARSTQVPRKTPSPQPQLPSQKSKKTKGIFLWSQTTDQVSTIKTHTESSKSERFWRGRRLFKVLQKSCGNVRNDPFTRQSEHYQHYRAIGHQP